MKGNIKGNTHAKYRLSASRRRRKVYGSTPEHRRNKRYRFFQFGFFALLAALALLLYSQYDYLLFKFLITEHYIFSDTLDQIYIEAVGESNFKDYWRNFDQMVMSVVTEKIRGANQDRYTYLYTPQGYQKSKSEEIADAKAAIVEELANDTVYVYIPNISKLSRQFLYDNKESIMPYANLILDLRDNYGGLLADFYRMADLFIDKGKILGYEQTRWGIFSHAVKSKGKTYFCFERIIILQNHYTASAAEGMIMALKQNLPDVTLIGEQTFGKGIGQVTIPAKQGYAIRATVLLVQGPDGESIHHIGIEPDIPGDENEDWVFKALALLEPMNE